MGIFSSKSENEEKIEIDRNLYKERKDEIQFFININSKPKSIKRIKCSCLLLIVNEINKNKIQEKLLESLLNDFFIFLTFKLKSTKLLIKYIKESKTNSFFSESNNSWLLDFYYLFYFDKLEIINSKTLCYSNFVYDEENNDYTNLSKVWKIKYDTTNDINIIQFINEKELILEFIKKIDLNNDELSILNKVDIDSQLCLTLAVKYDFLFIFILKSTYLKNMIKFNLICNMFIDNCRHSSIFKFIMSNKLR